MTENEIAAKVLDASFRIHRELGPGLMETVYEVILTRVLEREGLSVIRQWPVSVRFENLLFEEGFRADLLVDEKVLVELKSVESLQPIHGKQMMTYLKLSGLKLGLLINFNEALLRSGIKRVANGL